MKIRKELNAILYSRKMEEYNPPHHLTQYSKYISIINGDLNTVKSEISTGKLYLLSDERELSKSAIKNAVYHFILSSSAIAQACIEMGLGQSESDMLFELYLSKVDNCNSVNDIIMLYEDMCLDYSERMQEIRKESVISLHIRKCIDYIYENLGADLSVNALSAIIGLNSAYLSKLFRKEVGTTIKQFVKEARVDTAMNLLKYSNLSYSVISNSLGFSTQSVFIAVFKDITGMTPKVYRDMNYMIHK